MTSSRRSGTKLARLYADLAADERVVRFIEHLLVHTQGRWAGRPFRLAPWQRDRIIRPLFGTLRANGTRRYRTALIELPRKNGKSQLAAAVALYLLCGDGEIGAEVYSGAADKEQARRVFGEAKRMVEASPILSQILQVYKDVIYNPETGGVYRVLSADAPTKHGLNPHGVIMDELHAQRTRDLWDALTTAQGTRKQPLVVAITTAGSDTTTICYELHQYGAQVRDGHITDPTFFSTYYGALPDADWTDETVWMAANPAVSGPGRFLSLRYLREQFKMAREIPAQQNVFRQFYLNQWVQQATRWIDLTVWDENAGHTIGRETFGGATCYGGLDLAAVSDMTAWVLVAQCAEDPDALDILPRFWIPEARLHHGENRHLYQPWVKAGWLSVTPGDAVDYDFIIAQVVEDARMYNLIDLNLDRLFQGAQVETRLTDVGLAVIAMGQGFFSMAAPTKEFERCLLGRKLHHGGHPILRWMADNVIVKQDAAGNLKVDRAKSRQKVDGIVALIMALDRWMRARDSEASSVYDHAGLFTI